MTPHVEAASCRFAVLRKKSGGAAKAPPSTQARACQPARPSAFAAWQPKRRCGRMPHLRRAAAERVEPDAVGEEPHVERAGKTDGVAQLPGELCLQDGCRHTRGGAVVRPGRAGF